MIATTPQIEIIVKRLIDFVMKNRKRKAFFNMNRSAIEEVLRQDIMQRSCVWIVDEVDNIIGMAHGVADYNTFQFYVSNILTVDKRGLKILVEMFNTLFPEFTLAGHRYDKKKEYNTPRFKRFFVSNN